MNWYEPLTYSRRMRRYKGQSVPFVRYLVLGVACGALFLLLGLGAWAVYGRPSPMEAGLVALAFGGVFTILPYVINEWMPAWIVFRDKGIDRRTFRGLTQFIETWAWDDITHCRIERVKDRGREFHVLAVTSAGGHCVPLALSKPDLAEKLRSWFESQNRPFQHSTVRGPAELEEVLENSFAPSETHEIHFH